MPLIKSVHVNLHVYYMSLFRMPKGVIAELEKIQRQFLWGDYKGKKKLRLVDWNTIC